MNNSPEFPGKEKASGALEAPTLKQIAEELERVRARNRTFRLFRNTVAVALVAAAAAVLLVLVLFPAIEIGGTSMEDTLLEGDMALAARGARYREGDVVGFYEDDKILVKRIIALAGDVVDIEEDGSVYVNGRLLEEKYVKEKALGNCDIEFPCQVPEGTVFVLGDHRLVSVDSRSSGVGCVEERSILGKVVLRIWPLDRIGFVE